MGVAFFFDASKEVGLEINVAKIKNILLPHCQKAGLNCDIKTANRECQNKYNFDSGGN
jgi:hypothetical protein